MIIKKAAIALSLLLVATCTCPMLKVATGVIAQNGALPTSVLSTWYPRQICCLHSRISSCSFAITSQKKPWYCGMSIESLEKRIKIEQATLTQWNKMQQDPHTNGYFKRALPKWEANSRERIRAYQERIAILKDELKNNK